MDQEILEGNILVLNTEPGKIPADTQALRAQFRPPFSQKGKKKLVEQKQVVWLDPVQTGLPHPMLALLGTALPVPANQAGIPIGAFLPYGYMEQPWSVPILQAWDLPPEEIQTVLSELQEKSSATLHGREAACPETIRRAVQMAKENPKGFIWSITTGEILPGPTERQNLLLAIAALPALGLVLKEDGTPRDFSIEQYPEDGVFLRFAGPSVLTPTEKQRMSAFITGYCLDRTYSGQ
jgi:hypothetical protein